MYQERKGLFGTTTRVDVTPIDQASPEQLGGWIRYWDENRNAAAGLLVTTTAILAGEGIGLLTGKVSPSSDAAKILIMGANAADIVLSAIAMRAYSSFQAEANIIAQAVRDRGLKIKKGRLARSVELPQSNVQ
ncbi:hypothetical protein A2870_02605 [Candidatus Curtissbacteria bacterium RIFCSPHIGHO2_01_FULL_41_11]|uniref:Uncharacterized protein n=1 Tax=Candidatus Curtissbacteria bacterium RIFCSPHIGHO2_01_FULL_41_11 TaxID=1797711 RepID=A0A1F5G7Y2_9BACT|nr:MAG: hypothetical protein A2870_02605 [Candidatus Curtissbacteria bacterium RIFCSPHIGHO2_01_FULL_41_11]